MKKINGLLSRLMFTAPPFSTLNTDLSCLYLVQIDQIHIYYDENGRRFYLIKVQEERHGQKS